MSILTSAFFYTARLRVTPAPATLSETFAILSELKQFGTIATFVQDEAALNSTTSRLGRSGVNSQPYSVVYTALAPRLQAIKLGLAKDPAKKSIRFDVSSNAVYPNPRDLDPYNVRGLLQRKPRPKAQTFACTLTLEEQSEAHPGENVLGVTENGGPFSVDRDDGFAWTLARSTTPTGLITGLLPRTNKIPKTVKTRRSGIASGFTPFGENLARRSNSHGKPTTSTDTTLGAFSLSKKYREAVEKRSHVQGDSVGSRQGTVMAAEETNTP